MTDKAVMSRFYDAVAAGELGVIDELLVDDFVEHEAIAPTPDREGVRQFFTMLGGTQGPGGGANPPSQTPGAARSGRPLPPFCGDGGGERVRMSVHPREGSTPCRRSDRSSSATAA